jgi:hypothetical protein
LLLCGFLLHALLLLLHGQLAGDLLLAAILHSGVDSTDNEERCCGNRQW